MRLRIHAQERVTAGHVRLLLAAVSTATSIMCSVTSVSALSRLCLQLYQVDEKTAVPRLPRPDAWQKEILAALRIRLPEK